MDLLPLSLDTANHESGNHCWNQDTIFYHIKLNQYPALSAKIRFEVIYNKNYSGEPVMDIYTRQHFRNSNRNCSAFPFGQLRNEDLFLSLAPGKYRGSNCIKQTKAVVKCTGDKPIQDYAPTYFSISFAYLCTKQNGRQSLMGLKYNITIYGLANFTRCIKTFSWYDANRFQHGPCRSWAEYTSVPNLVGNFDLDIALNHQNYYFIVSTYQLLSEITPSFPCHKHMEALFCRSMFPNCEPSTGFTEPVCREFCEEVMDACWDLILEVATLMSSSNEWNIHLLSTGDFELPIAKHILLNCEYLPSYNSSVSCFHRQVTCQRPPSVQNAKVMTVGTNPERYDVYSTAVYSCTTEAKMQGNNTIVCLFTGEWSEPPRCTVTKSLPIVAGVFSVPVVLLVVVCLVSSFKSKLNVQLIRNREFDVFVCFQFDADNDFVMNVLKPILEPEFKLFIHSIDFKPGINIHTNILGAIDKSNAAIIVLSDGFVDSQWCKQESEFCYRETSNDPAFKLLVILMQPEETLNLSMETCALITHFVQNQTYLEFDDQKLWEKIGTHLLQVKGEKKANKQAKRRTLETDEEEAAEFLEGH